jgi:hypothetical protein
MRNYHEETVRLNCQYGELQSRVPYKLVERGFDWAKLKNNGRVYFVPLSLVDFGDYSQYEDYEQYREYEEIDE